MAFDTATILDQLAERIEALTPATQANRDDRYQVTIGVDAAMVGKRHVLLEAEGGIRRPSGGRTCDDWQTTVEITTDYPLSQGERGARGVYSHALQDSEDMLADLYLWSVTTAAIQKIEPQPATIDDDGKGVLRVLRTIYIEFKRS